LGENERGFKIKKEKLNFVTDIVKYYIIIGTSS
jgi:hypothetical protein